MLLCFLQLTFVSCLAWVLGQLALKRSPNITAKTAAAGITISFCIVATSFLPVSRPWRVRLALPLSSEEHRADINHPSALDQRQSGPIGNALKRAAWPLIRLHLDPPSETKVLTFEPATVVCLAIAVVCTCLLLRHVYGILALMAMHRESREVPWTRGWPRMAQCACRLRLTVRESAKIDSPCVSWLSRSVVYVPPSFDTWSQEEQEAALVHELAHLLRNDAIHRFGAAILATLLWFHPFIRALFRQFKLAQEMAADRQAVSLLGDCSKYVRGLCRLTLRFDDSRLRHRALVISVYSNDMIRRIAMLRTLKVTGRRPNALLGSGATLFLIGCGVVAACIADDSQPTERIARRSATASSRTANAQSFLHPRIEPWKAIGVGQGYFAFRPSELAECEFAHPLVKALSDGVLRAAASHEIGLSFDNVDVLQGRVRADVSKIPHHLRTDGRKNSLRVTADAFDIRTHRPVDWPRASEEIHMAAIAPEQSPAVQRAREILGNRGIADHLRIVSAEFQEVSTDTTRRLQSVWELVDGGTFAVAVSVDDLIPDDSPSTEAIALLSALDIIAIGADLGNAENTTHTIRIALLPKSTVPAQETRNLFQAFAKSLGKKADGALATRICQELSNWRVQIEQSSNGDHLVIAGGAISNETLARLCTSL